VQQDTITILITNRNSYTIRLVQKSTGFVTLKRES